MNNCLSDRLAFRMTKAAQPGQVCPFFAPEDENQCCVKDDGFFVQTILRFITNGYSERMGFTLMQQLIELWEWDRVHNDSRHMLRRENVQLNVPGNSDSRRLLTFANDSQTRLGITLRIREQNVLVPDISSVTGEIIIRPFVGKTCSVTTASVRDLLLGNGTPSKISKLEITTSITGTLDDLAQIFVGTKIRRAKIHIPGGFTSRQVMEVLKENYSYEDTELDQRSINTTDLSMFVVEHPNNIIYFSMDFPVFP